MSHIDVLSINIFYLEKPTSMISSCKNSKMKCYKFRNKSLVKKSCIKMKKQKSPYKMHLVISKSLTLPLFISGMSFTSPISAKTHQVPPYTVFTLTSSNKMKWKISNIKTYLLFLVQSAKISK